MALTLFGVTVNDVHVTHATTMNAEVISVRDLAAICAQTEARPGEPGERLALHHNDVVAAFSGRGPVLPAPVGVVFRSKEAIERWLELHYGALTDALSFVENRVAARVHVRKAAVGDERETSADLVAMASESLRTLRLAAVATVALRPDSDPGVILSAAFLVEADSWPEFVAQVNERAKQSASVRLELTGPWPPYDFVQMQIGA